jgi:hypothetical protein
VVVGEDDRDRLSVGGHGATISHSGGRSQRRRRRARVAGRPRRGRRLLGGARSLAVFAWPGGLKTFRLPNRLPSVVEVADRFYVKPLLRATTFPQAAFVLALAAGSVRLVEVSREGPPFTVDVPDLPADAASAAGKASIADRSPSARLQGSEGQKVRLRQFARKVDQALRGVLTGSSCR